MKTRLTIAWAFALVGTGTVGCSGSGDGSTAGSAGATDSITTTAGVTGETASTGATTDDSGTAGSASDSGSATDSASGSASDSDSGPTASASDTATTSGGPKFDVADMPDVPVDGCGGGGGGGGMDPEFSYIWIANSSQNTVSKIDTETLVELGRYLVRPDGAGSPSRTSVSLSGDVAVASRTGGITKIYAQADDCLDTNGTPGIQTASDATWLPWGTEECVAWHTPFNHTTQRPVAWAPGTLNPQTCEYENEMVWTAAAENNVVDSLVVYRLNGTDGSIDATVPLPDVPVGYFGAYGGAVNQAGDFWFVIYDTSISDTYLVRVDYANLTHDKIAVPDTICPYGFTVDSKGRPWIGSFCQQSARYDPATTTWDLIPALGYGIQEDGEGRMWMADYALPGVREINSDTLALGAQIVLNGSASPKGISIDFKGNVWVVDQSKSAFRVDPDTQQYQVFDQLNGPYTYSDMTGWGLTNVTFPPG